MLHRIWLGFFVLAFACGVYQWLGPGDYAVFQRMVAALFDMAALSVELAMMRRATGAPAVGPPSCELPVDRFAAEFHSYSLRAAGQPAIQTDAITAIQIKLQITGLRLQITGGLRQRPGIQHWQ